MDIYYGIKVTLEAGTVTRKPEEVNQLGTGNTIIFFECLQSIILK